MTSGPSCHLSLKFYTLTTGGKGSDVAVSH